MEMPSSPSPAPDTDRKTHAGATGPDQTIVRQVILDVELPKDAQINHSGAVRTAVQMIKPPSRSAGIRADGRRLKLLSVTASASGSVRGWHSARAAGGSVLARRGRGDRAGT